MLIPTPIIASVAAAAAAATTLITTATIRNVAETISLCSERQTAVDIDIDIGIDNHDTTILNQYLTIRNDPISRSSSSSSNNGDDDKERTTASVHVNVPHGKTKSDVIHDLKSMKRKDLVRLFKHCDAPNDLSMIEGEWDGLLLHNNFVLTSITLFLTNVLFGKKRKWNGKEFKLVENAHIGINRFYPNEKQSTKEMEKEHSFDYSITSSSMFGKSSVQLRYSKYQSIFSLWNTMVDEVRVLKIPIAEREMGDRDEDYFDFVLLGVGSMAWSGGMYNCSPFCLYQPSSSLSFTSKESFPPLDDQKEL